MSRFQSLLNLFGLNDRMIYSIDEYNNTLLLKNIDWKRVNNIRAKETEKANQLLQRYLHINLTSKAI